MPGNDSKVTVVSSFGSGMDYISEDSLPARCDLTFHIPLEWFRNDRIRLQLRFVEERHLLTTIVHFVGFLAGWAKLVTAHLQND